MVLVCNDPRFVFLKTMKTAGTSVEFLFEQFCLPEGYATGGKREPVISERGIVGGRGIAGLERHAWRNHMPASEVADLLGEEAFGAALKFATVRNPYRTALSRFFFSMRIPYPATRAAFLYHRFKFRRWLSKWNPEELGNREIVHVDGTFVLDDFIRQETMTEDIGRIAGRLGLAVDSGSLKNHKRNAGHPERFPPSAYFNPRCIEVIEEAFGWCFDHCGYSRDVGEA